jgi:hypothetical protein
MASYVVKSWYADQKVNPYGQYVSIKGRVPGLISWAMSSVGISPTISLECRSNNFIYEIGSWSGKQVKTIPLTKISSVYYGYTKPWKEALLIGIIGFILGILIALMTKSFASNVVVTLLFWGLAISYYILNKDLSIGVCEVGGILSEINFRRSLIEGVAVDEANAERVHLIILALVERSMSKPG